MIGRTPKRLVRRLRAIAAGEFRRPAPPPCHNRGDFAAISRAVHALLDAPPAIVRDELAVALFARRKRQRWAANPGHFSPPGMNVRCGMLVRQRYAEDCLSAAIRDGARQYVILAAGLDSSSQRCVGLPQDFRIFEVDREAVQVWKQALLKYCGSPRCAAVEYVGVDFERQQLFERLLDHQYEPKRPTFFSWLGYTQYLHEQTVYRLLEAIARNAAPGSTIVLDYRLPAELLRAEDAAHLRRMMEQGARGGKVPWRSLFDPGAFEARLQDMASRPSRASAPIRPPPATSNSAATACSFQPGPASSEPVSPAKISMRGAFDGRLAWFPARHPVRPGSGGLRSQAGFRPRRWCGQCSPVSRTVSMARQVWMLWSTVSRPATAEAFS